MFEFGVIFSIFFGVVLVFIIGTMLVQGLIFGSVFYTVTKGISQTLDAQKAQQAALNNAATCEFCGAARTRDLSACSSCGAPQQTALPQAVLPQTTESTTDRVGEL